MRQSLQKTEERKKKGTEKREFQKEESGEPHGRDGNEIAQTNTWEHKHDYGMSGTESLVGTSSRSLLRTSYVGLIVDTTKQLPDFVKHSLEL